MTNYNFVSRGRPPGFENNSIIELGKLNNDSDFAGSAWNLTVGAGTEFFVGFVYDDAAYKTINHPGSRYTRVEGINDRGQVVGSYGSTQTAVGARGFILEGSTYKPVEVPNSRSNNAADINNNGSITGWYTDNDRINHGYIYESGFYKTIDVPGATNTYLSGLNDRGVAVGNYDLGTTARFGLVYENGSLRTLNYPGATDTYLSDVSNDGTIVGQAYLPYIQGDATYSGNGIGFTYKNGVFNKIDGTQAVTGINDRGQILALSQDRNILISDPLCFVTGTLIRTMRGDVPVEDLSLDDLAVTVSGEHRPIRWIGRRTLDCSQGPRGSAFWPVRVRAGAFGPRLPARDLRLSPGHPVLVGADEDGRGGVLVPIMCLIDGTSIACAPAASVTYWHIELDAHDILLAEGMPAESYFDMGSRGWFAAEDGPLVDPDFVPPGETGRCRPVAVDGGDVEAERARLSALLAATLGAQCDWDDAGRFAWVVA